jgi:hypothetical protein
LIGRKARGHILSLYHQDIPLDDMLRLSARCGQR